MPGGVVCDLCFHVDPQWIHQVYQLRGGLECSSCFSYWGKGEWSWDAWGRPRCLFCRETAAQPGQPQGTYMVVLQPPPASVPSSAPVPVPAPVVPQEPAPILAQALIPMQVHELHEVCLQQQQQQQQQQLGPVQGPPQEEGPWGSLPA